MLLITILPRQISRRGARLLNALQSQRGFQAMAAGRRDRQRDQMCIHRVLDPLGQRFQCIGNLSQYRHLTLACAAVEKMNEMANAAI